MQATGAQNEEGLEFFQSILTGFNSINADHQKQIAAALPGEAVQVATKHAQESRAFCEGLLAEAEAVNVTVQNLRAKIRETHGAGPDKSYLKASLAAYEKCVPSIDITSLKKLLDQDIEVSKGILERSS